MMASGGGFGANREDVRFDAAAALALIDGCRRAAQEVRGQRGSREGWRSAGAEGFQGFWAGVFESNGRAQVQAIGALADALEAVADDVAELKEKAAEEQARREAARAWLKKKEEFEYDQAHTDGLFDWLGDRFAGGFTDRRPPMDPVEPPRFGAPAPPVGGRDVSMGRGGGGGASSAGPGALDSFAASTRGGDAALAGWPGGLRVLDRAFQDGTEWGGVDAGGVWAAFEEYLADNEADARWAQTVAGLFRAAGGDGAPVSLPDAAVGAALEAAGLPASRDLLAVEPPRAYGGQATSGYSDDPVNTATGNFTETETDLGFPGGCASLVLSRTYNALDRRAGGFGPGWSSWADSRLAAAGESARWVRPDGRVSVFPKDGDGWGHADGEALWLAGAPGGWEVSDNAGGRCEFDRSGRPVSVSRGAGTRVGLLWDARGRLAGLAHERGRSVTLEWDDPAGRIVAAAASDGRRVSYSYDQEGRLVQAARPDGARSYRWDAAGLVDRVADGDGVVEVENTYDSSGRVASQRSRSGRESRYSYLPGRVTAVAAGDGSRANTWVADDRGRLVKLVDSDGRAQTMVYDRWGNPAVVAGRDGQTTIREFDGRGRRVFEQTPAGAKLSWAWDELDRVVSAVVDNAGAVAETRLEYEGDSRDPSVLVDAEGGVTKMTWRDGLLAEVTDPTGVRLSFTHDGRGDLVATTDAAGNVARLERDQCGRVTAAVTPLGHRTEYAWDQDTGLLRSRRDPDGATTRWEHTRGGRVTAIIDPLGGRLAMEYGPDGRRAKTTDPLGRQIATRHDDLGNLAAVELPDGTTWRFGYDAMSQLTAMTDGSGAAWHIGHDANGNPTSTIDPTGIRRAVQRGPGGWATRVDDGEDFTTAAYDRLGRIVDVAGPDGTASKQRYDLCGRLVERVDPGGGVTRFQRDAAGRVIAVTQPMGATYRYEYDECGRWAATVSTGGSRYEMVYDADSRIAGEVWPDGGRVRTQFDAAGRIVRRDEPGKGVVRFRYDKAGRLVSVRDPWWGWRSFRYDAAGQMVAAVNGLGGVTRFDYDAAGRVAAVTDPAGATTTRAYDGMGRLTSTTDPLGRTTRHAYDPAGRPLAWRDDGGKGLDWTYDHHGLRKDTVADGRLVSSVERDFAGRAITVTGPGGAVQSRFDALGRLVSRSRDGIGPAWTYDSNGRRETMTAPDGTVTRYSYDPDSRLAAVDHPGLGRITLDRDRLGRIVALAADGLRATWEYRDGWVSKHVTNKNGFVQITHVERDPDGRVVAQTVDGIRTAFAYDDAGQLVSAVTGEGLETAYQYDPAGRLTAETRDGKTTRYAHDPAGQLVSRRDPDGSQLAYAYDPAGRRTKETGPDGERLFTWDPRGFLAEITSIRHDHDRVTATTRRLTVDPAGELASIDQAPVWWDSASAEPQTIAVGQTTLVPAGPAQAILGGGSPAWLDLGRPGPAGADPWAAAGPADATAGPDGVGPDDPISGGVGPARASVTIDGLQWLGYRVYDPASRGFLSGDPLTAPPGAAWASNPYAFAGNDPVNKADPCGLSPVSAEDFDHYRDRFPAGIGGTLSDAHHATGNWLKDNWEYVAAGAMVIAGGVMMATGVGGPVGMALISAGADGIIQKATTGSVDWTQVAINGVIGLASGGVAGAAGKLAAKSVTNCLGRNILSGATEGFVDGSISGAGGYLTSGQPITLAGLTQATLGGGLIGGLTGGAAGGASKITNTAKYGCFEADTPVLMADGTTKPIQDIQVGDQVAAWNPDTRQTEPRPVTDTYTHHDVPTLRVTTTAGQIITTATHPFYVQDKGYVPAAELHAGDQLHTPDGTQAQILTIQHTGHTQTVHNLAVAQLHNYHVSAGTTQILVHNASTQFAAGCGPRATVDDMAADLADRIGRNSVSYSTPNTMGHIDLAGRPHFDKPTGQVIPTPHVHESVTGINPKTAEPFPIRKTETVRPATPSDIRTAERLAQIQGLLP